MKTAMQQAIEFFETNPLRQMWSSTQIANILRNSLQIEQVQIEDAYNIGKDHERNGALSEVFMRGSDYFTEKFNQ